MQAKLWFKKCNGKIELVNENVGIVGRIVSEFMRAICKICGLAAGHHCYTEGGGDYYAKL
jgi:hypothetical protein